MEIRAELGRRRFALCPLLLARARKVGFDTDALIFPGGAAR